MRAPIRSGGGSRASTAVAALMAALSVGCIDAMAGEQPLLTWEALLKEPRSDRSALMWLGGEGLFHAGRIWSTDGSATPSPWPKGAIPSPDGRLMVVTDEMGPAIRETKPPFTVVFALDSTFQVEVVSWSPDSTRVVLAEVIRPPAVQEAIIRSERGTRVINVSEQQHTGGEALRYQSIMHVVILDSAPKGERIEVEGRVHDELGWGPDGSLYFSPVRYSGWAGAQPYTPVKRWDSQTGRITEVFKIKGFMQGLSPAISPDGQWLAMAVDFDGQIRDEFVSLVALSLRTGELRRLTTKEKVLSRTVAWTGDSRSVVFANQDGAWSQLHRVDLDGGHQTLTSSPTYKLRPKLSSSGRLLAYLSEDGQGRYEIRVTDLQDASDRRVALLNDPAARWALGQVKQVRIPMRDGLQLAAFIVFPPDFDSIRRYPAHIDVHGGGPSSPLGLAGPLTAGLVRTPLEWHVWAALGYVVFVTDYRSSGEYGPEIAARRYRDHDYNGVQEDATDIADATRYLVALDYIDAQRIAIFGHSAGGGRVNLVRAQSSLYRAAVMNDMIGAGVLPDLITGISGQNTGRPQWEPGMRVHVGARLAENPEVYASNFLFDGYRSRTPALILTGGNRARGALNPLSSEILYSVLTQYQIPVKMVRYVDEGHVYEHPEAVLHAARTIHDWYCEHMDLASDANGRLLFGDDKRVKSRQR